MQLNLTGIPAKKGNGYELERGQWLEKVVISYFQKAGLYTFKPEQPELTRKMMTAMQMDAVIQLSPGTYQRLEVKGRSGKVWRWAEILVGDVWKWEAKEPEVSILVVVEEDTGDARFCLADKARIASKWKRTSQGYKVPISEFKSLDVLVDAYNETKVKRAELERQMRELQTCALGFA